MIKAEVIKDSVSTTGARLTTFVLTYPRFIHSEFMTHRMFSRNASSSRAIPVEKQIKLISENPVVPLAFTKNKKGMQGGVPLEGKDHELAEKIWRDALLHALDKAKMLADLGVHKQYANRLLEPFSHITVVCSATEFDNFFALRIHEAAQPEIRELATQMYKLYTSSVPQKLNIGEWHLPFVDSTEGTEENIKRSVAKCARVSYLNHDGTETTLEQDLQLYDRLLGSIPIHASPAEHQAYAAFDSNEWSANFKGWVQYRKTLKNENITSFSPKV